MDEGVSGEEIGQDSLDFEPEALNLRRDRTGLLGPVVPVSKHPIPDLGDGEDLKLISGGINHVPDVSGAFVPKIHWSAYSEQTLTGGVIGIKFIYI